MLSKHSSRRSDVGPTLVCRNVSSVGGTVSSLRLGDICPLVKCVSISSGNRLLPSRRQGIIWTNACFSSVVRPGRHIGEISIKVNNFHSGNAFENIMCHVATILFRLQFLKCRDIEMGHVYSMSMACLWHVYGMSKAEVK